MSDSAADRSAAGGGKQAGNESDGAARFSGARRPGARPEAMVPLGSYDLPETRSYRLKNRILGKPLVNEQMKAERLGKPTAMAVLSSDVISSSAYATEEILTILIPYIGLAAFSLILPVSALILVILAAVAASYFQVVKAYPKAGGAYIVARDNFGPRIAQIAAVAIMIDYTVTVAISVAAGVDAVTSAIPALAPYNLYLALLFVVLLAYGNLRGVREAGRIFAIPAYFFMANMAIMLGLGIYKAVTHQLHYLNPHASGALVLGGHTGSGLLLGASLFIFLQAFANGGTAVTGIEAVSTGVSIFRAPQWRNARVVLVAMAIILGLLFFGLSFLSTYIHPIPRLTGTPTVISMIAQSVYGDGTMGRVLYYMLQSSTYLILIFAANTSFNGFPFLVSYAAEDSFLPRQLARRGHRLALSNGIVLLTIFSELILIGTRARVSSLVAMYAIGVYTGFAMASGGMLKYHVRNKAAGYKKAFAINAVATVASTIVVLVFLVTKFTEGAWVVLAVGIPLVFVFIRLNQRYAAEAEELEQNVAGASEAPVLRKHKVLLFVENLDLATARAIQYARSLTPDEIRAVHIEVDAKQARALEQDWTRLGVHRLDLEVVECPDRRIRRAALDVAAEAAAPGDTEVTVLLPRRVYRGFLQRVLHDRTADSMAKVLSQVPHVNATIIPFEVVLGGSDRVVFEGRTMPVTEKERTLPQQETEVFGERMLKGSVPIGDVVYRRRAKVAGRVKSVRLQPMDSVPSLAVRLEDPSGGILLVFAGKRQVPGIEPGRRMTAEGTVGEIEGHMAIMNPTYEFAPVEEED